LYEKLLSVLIALVLILASVSGCAQGTDETSAQDSSSSTSQNESSDGETTEPLGDPEKIIVTFLTTGNTPEDLPKVQDAVNEITIEKINVEVEFMPVKYW
jgi:putative aldouronate transport system substrate-binding protein